jgi:hypothetical protein
MWHPTGVRRWLLTALIGAATLAAAAPATAATLPKIPQPDRREIMRLLHRFVPEAAGRVHPGRARFLATPQMRALATPAQWRAGNLPVFPFPVSNAPYGIRPISVTPDDITFDLMLHPKPGSDVGVEVYTTEVRKIGGRWLVNEMFPTAQFASPGSADTIVAQPDFAPHQAGLPFRNNLSQKLWFVVLAVVGLPLIAAPVGFLILWRRGRVRPDAEARERASAPWR